MLSTEDIRYLLDELSHEVVVEPSEMFPYRISRMGHGYSKDKQRGRIQAALSIMLEVAMTRRK